MSDIYIGHYVKCKTTAQEVAVINNKACKNCNTFVFADERNKFCCVCGKALTDIFKNKKAIQQNPFHIMDKCNEKLTEINCNYGGDKDYHYYIPNISCYDCYHYDLAGLEFKIEHTIEWANDARAYFYDKFSDELDILRQEYGKDNVNVYYGILNARL